MSPFTQDFRFLKDLSPVATWCSSRSSSLALWPPSGISCKFRGSNSREIVLKYSAILSPISSSERPGKSELGFHFFGASLFFKPVTAR